MEESLLELPQILKKPNLFSLLQKYAIPLPIKDLLSLAQLNPYRMSFSNTSRASDRSVFAETKEPERAFKVDRRYFINKEPSA